MGVALAACGSASGTMRARKRKGGTNVNMFPEQYRAEILAYQRSYLNDPTGIRSAGSRSLRCAASAAWSATSSAFASPRSCRAGATAGCAITWRSSLRASSTRWCHARALQGRGLRAVSRAGEVGEVDRHGQACPGHPRLDDGPVKKVVDARHTAGMTKHP